MLAQLSLMWFPSKFNNHIAQAIPVFAAYIYAITAFFECQGSNEVDDEVDNNTDNWLTAVKLVIEKFTNIIFCQCIWEHWELFGFQMTLWTI